MTPSTPTCCAWFSSSSTLYTGTSGWPFSWASWLMARENGTTDATCVWLSMTCAFSGSGCGAGAQLRSRWCLLMPPAYARWRSCFGSRFSSSMAVGLTNAFLCVPQRFSAVGGSTSRLQAVLAPAFRRHYAQVGRIRFRDGIHRRPPNVRSDRMRTDGTRRSTHPSPEY